jgi:hypothetical protein
MNAYLIKDWCKDKKSNYTYQILACEYDAILSKEEKKQNSIDRKKVYKKIEEFTEMFKYEL